MLAIFCPVPARRGDPLAGPAPRTDIIRRVGIVKPARAGARHAPISSTPAARIAPIALRNLKNPRVAGGQAVASHSRGGRVVTIPAASSRVRSGPTGAWGVTTWSRPRVQAAITAASSVTGPGAGKRATASSVSVRPNAATGRATASGERPSVANSAAVPAGSSPRRGGSRDAGRPRAAAGRCGQCGAAPRPPASGRDQVRATPRG